VQPAVDRARLLGSAWSARVVLFHAAFDSALSGRPFFDSRRLANSRGWYVAEQTARLKRWAAPLIRSGLTVDTIVQWEEPAHESIIRAVLRCQADLVIAACHDRSRDRPPQWRWTDWELMRLCPRPLLLAALPSRGRRRGPVLAALDPAHTHDKPASLDAAIARCARTLADALESGCHAMHCLPSRAATRPGHSRERLQSKLHQILKRAGVQSARVHMRRGRVAETAITLVQELDAQVLAMGIVSRRGLSRLLIGDTAAEIIRRVPCDLLLIKPKGFKLRLGRSRSEAINVPRGER
jgi:universal stress protein E